MIYAKKNQPVIMSVRLSFNYMFNVCHIFILISVNNSSPILESIDCSYTLLGNSCKCIKKCPSAACSDKLYYLVGIRL